MSARSKRGQDPVILWVGAILTAMLAVAVYLGREPGMVVIWAVYTGMVS